MKQVENGQQETNKVVRHGNGVYALEKWKHALRSTEEKLSDLKSSKLWDENFLKIIENTLVKKG